MCSIIPLTQRYYVSKDCYSQHPKTKLLRALTCREIFFHNRQSAANSEAQPPEPMCFSQYHPVCPI